MDSLAIASMMLKAALILIKNLGALMRCDPRDWNHTISFEWNGLSFHRLDRRTQVHQPSFKQWPSEISMGFLSCFWQFSGL